MGQTQSDKVRIVLLQHDPVNDPSTKIEKSSISTYYTLKVVEVNSTSLYKLLGQKIMYLRQLEIKNGQICEFRLPSFPSRDGEYRVFGVFLFSLKYFRAVLMLRFLILTQIIIQMFLPNIISFLVS